MLFVLFYCVLGLGCLLWIGNWSVSWIRYFSFRLGCFSFCCGLGVFLDFLLHAGFVVVLFCCFVYFDCVSVICSFYLLFCFSLFGLVWILISCFDCLGWFVLVCLTYFSGVRLCFGS